MNHVARRGKVIARVRDRQGAIQRRLDEEMRLALEMRLNEVRMGVLIRQINSHPGAQLFDAFDWLSTRLGRKKP